MYRLSHRRHAPVKHADALGGLSYLGVQVFSRHKPSVMTSNSCATLGTSTFTHVPPANIIFSFTSYKITRKVVNDGDGNVTYLTLDKPAKKIFDSLQPKLSMLVATVKAIRNPPKPKGRGMKDTVEVDSDVEEDLDV